MRVGTEPDGDKLELVARQREADEVRDDGADVRARLRRGECPVGAALDGNEAARLREAEGGEHGDAERHLEEVAHVDRHVAIAHDDVAQPAAQQDVDLRDQQREQPVEQRREAEALVR